MPSSADLYAAKVNPSRRAKSLAYSYSESSVDRAQAQLPQLLSNAPQNPLMSSELDGQLPQEVPAPVVGRKRRGRKPGSGAAFPSPSRAAREAARRESHSRIEKARRGKINDALDALRAMVPLEGELTSNSDTTGLGKNEEALSENEDDKEHLHGRASKAGSSKPKQPEFKLDILERTVIFMRALLERVEHLEKSACAHGAPSSTGGSIQRRRNKAGAMSTHSAGVVEEGSVEERASKRRRLDDDPREEEAAGDVDEDEDSASEEEDELGNSMPTPTSSDPPRFSLPSIHSLLEISANTLPPPSTIVHASTSSSSSYPHSYLPSPTLSPLVHPAGSGPVSPTFRSRSGLSIHDAYLPSPPFSVASSSTTARTSTSTSPTFSAVSSSSHSHSHAAHPHSPFPHLPAPALTNIASKSKGKRRASESESSSHSFSSSRRDSVSPYLENDRDHEQTMALTLLQMRSPRTSVTEVKATPSSILGINKLRRRESESESRESDGQGLDN